MPLVFRKGSRSALLAILLIAGIAFWDRNAIGELNGEAQDSSGAVVPNVAVSDRNLETNRVYSRRPTTKAYTSARSRSRSVIRVTL